MTVPYNPYAANGGSANQQTVELAIVIQELVNAQLVELHTCLPGLVTQVRDNAQVDVQPMLMRKYVTGSVVKVPVIQNVPVCMPRGSDYWVKLPVAVNDTGLLVFSERSLDKWKVSGGILDPDDNRKFDYTDAVFVPGLYPFSNQTMSGDPDELVMHNGQAEVVLQKPGTFLVKNGSYELFETLDQLLDALQNAMTLTALGPQPFIASTQAALAQVRTQIDSLKGS